MDTYRFTAGTTPVLMSIPHLGFTLPEALKPRMTEAALASTDTDWHLDQLYDFAPMLGCSVIAATYSRYAIDLNRAPDGTQLYPGASNTELVPLTSFDREPLYRNGYAPTQSEIEERRKLYWNPYHERLHAELRALRDKFGVAVLFDCHSIRSHVPRFFDGKIWDFNLGTADGKSADPELRRRLIDRLQNENGFTLAIDGRFTGGYITRQYGKPAENIHAFQMELSWATYMDESPPFAYRADLAANVKPALRRMLEAAVEWAKQKAAG
ncbi:MAG: N-formylglutamate deformylase [Alphaproteobacteria bacterium]